MQQGYSRELAGAMLFESDEFFDRALMLYLLRSHLRQLQASTWGGVATYYCNYFLALSFLRLHMKSVTHLPSGPVFEMERVDDAAPVFKIQERNDRQRHGEVWRAYYDAIIQMAWPDGAVVAELAPTLSTLRFREQTYRERINYRPGEGFEEIYQSRKRYLQFLRSSLKEDGAPLTALSDHAYTDRMAFRRLRHVASLLHRLSSSRTDTAVESSRWHRRREIVTRYAHDQSDRRLAGSLINGG